MKGFCSSPGHQDRPARLYPCGWRCEGCAPGQATTTAAGRGFMTTPSSPGRRLGGPEDTTDKETTR